MLLRCGLPIKMCYHSFSQLVFRAIIEIFNENNDTEAVGFLEQRVSL